MTNSEFMALYKIQFIERNSLGNPHSDKYYAYTQHSNIKKAVSASFFVYNIQLEFLKCGQTGRYSIAWRYGRGVFRQTDR